MLWERKTAFYTKLEEMGKLNIVAMLSTLEARLTGRKGRFSVDQDGDWVNTQKEATFVSPDALITEFSELMPAMYDVWCHQSTPKYGDTVIDIGAGIGDEAIAFSRMVGPSGHVFSIEANPGVFRCLRKTIARSGLKNVTAVQCAIADKAGTLTINDIAGSQHIENSIIRSNGEGISVEACSLEQFFDRFGLNHVALLKMNIEGAERLALEGLGNCKGKIANYAISCHDFLADRNGDDALRTREDTIRFFTQNGFEIAQRKQDARPWVRDFVYAQDANALVCSPEM